MSKSYFIVVSLIISIIIGASTIIVDTSTKKSKGISGSEYATILLVLGQVHLVILRKSLFN
jgi:hypothetical protein